MLGPTPCLVLLDWRLKCPTWCIPDKLVARSCPFRGIVPQQADADPSVDPRRRCVSSWSSISANLYTAGNPLQLVCVALPQNFEKCLDQYLDIEPKAPIVDVPQIELHALRNMLDRRCSTSRTITLGPTRHARLNMVAKGIIAQDLLEIVVVGQRVRAWPD
jgi:hypothetical protein